VSLSRPRLSEFVRHEPAWKRVVLWCVGRKFAAMLDEHLRLGDSRAAVVVDTMPLLVAAYSSDIDCVALLRFPEVFVERHGLRAGSRLLTVNMYAAQFAVTPDLDPGPDATGDWQNFYPLIAEFLSEDVDRIAFRKAEIDESEWSRCTALGQAYVQSHPGLARSGSPFASDDPATPR